MEEHYRKLEHMYASARSQEHFTNQIRVSEGEARLTLPVSEKYFHAANAVHGHVYFKVMDDVAFFAANSMVTGHFVLTSSFTTYLTRPINKGSLHGVGRVVHRSKNLIIAEAVVTNDEGKEIARGSGTFMKSSLPLTEDIGYKI